ncbi:MAG: hypothetical protein Q9223_000528 [Gallowayella weberi]
MGTTVTIDKSYFETLLRRAEFHVSGQDFTTPLDLPTVSIPKVDHDNLLRMAQEYMSLRDALYRGGIAQETLEILIRGPQNSEEPSPVLQDVVDGTRDGPTQASRTSHPQTLPQHSGSRFNWPASAKPASSKMQDDHYTSSFNNGYSDSCVEKDEDEPVPAPKSGEQPDRRNEKRTLLLQNLPDQVCHQDIVSIVRGGLLLDVYLRPVERSASISFVDGSAAQEFLAYIKRNDMYLRGRRLSWEWSERQFYMPGHVASKIRIGATRNLVIRSVKPDITEQRLREDLDHIHNLIIISISFVDGDVYLSLNSIHNALFARTCMMSRAMYRGMRIDWYPDECALPLPKVQNPSRREMAPTPKPKTTPMVNRFQMLNMDEDATDDSSFEDEGDGTTTPGFSPLKSSRRSPLDLSTAAA